MPIKNLTDRRRLPRIGKFHLGIMVQTQKGVPYPKATDYFVYPGDGSPGAELRDELIKNFGEKPKELRIIFPLEDEEKIASQYYRCYSKTRGLICKGDGEICLRMVDKQTGNLADRDSQQVEMREMPCQGRDCPDYGTKCREVMNLQFMLPEISGLGIWQIDTSSINSIRNINSNLDMLRAIYKRIRMIPLILALEQIEVTNPDDGKKKKVWVMNLRSTDNMVQAAIKARMEPLELATGISEDITPDEVIDLPVSDDERPELITPDYEPKGPPITPHPEDAEQDVRELWPEDKPSQTAAIAVPLFGQAETAPVKESIINLDWLKESLSTLRATDPVAWSEDNVLSYMKASYGIAAETVLGCVVLLDKGKSIHFEKRIQEALKKEKSNG